MKTTRLSCAAALLSTLILTQVIGGDVKPTEPKVMLDAKATAILRGALEYLNNTKNYTTTLTHKTTLDAGPGKVQTRESKYELAVERPNKLALVIKDGKLRCAVLSDGKMLCTYAPPIKKYTQKEAPKSLQELFDIDEMSVVRQDLSSLLFLDQFSLKNAFEALMEGVISLKLEEPENFGDLKINKLHFTQENMEWYLWVQDGKEPLVRKVAIEGEQMMEEGGQQVKVKRSIVTQFDDWKINADLPADRFTFTPPKDSTKVDSFMEQPYEPNLVGTAAPALNGKLLDGGAFNLADQKGKNVVLLDFWATWCGPCRMAMPIVSDVVGAYKDKGVVGYAVNLGENVEKIKEFMNESKTVKLPILLDEDGKAAEAYHVQPIPMTVIVDKAGIVQVVHLGVPRNVEQFKDQLKTELDTLLAGKSLLKEAPKKEPEAK